MVATVTDIKRYVRVPLELPIEFLSDIMRTAFDIQGACGGWAVLIGPMVIEGPEHALAEGDANDIWYSLRIVTDDLEEHQVDHSTIVRGLQVMVEHHSTPKLWIQEIGNLAGRFIRNEEAINHAVQYGVFGEVRFP